MSYLQVLKYRQNWENKVKTNDKRSVYFVPTRPTWEKWTYVHIKRVCNFIAGSLKSDYLLSWMCARYKIKLTLVLLQ